MELFKKVLFVVYGWWCIVYLYVWIIVMCWAVWSFAMPRIWSAGPPDLVSPHPITFFVIGTTGISLWSYIRKLW